jgi:hypothetical protein
MYIPRQDVVPARKQRSMMQINTCLYQNPHCQQYRHRTQYSVMLHFITTSSNATSAW